MTATLSFNLPEESEELETALKAQEFKDAVRSFYQDSLRKRMKFTDETSVSLEVIMGEFRDAFEGLDWC
jgi:hypothetical protein